MLLRHMTDMRHDLPAQMHALSRLTTNMHTYGMPESNETLFLRLGLDHLMDLIKDAAPTD